MKRKLNLFLILMVSFGLILSVSAIGCGGDDDPVVDGDTDTDDVVTPDGDEDDTVEIEDIVVDGDETEVPDTEEVTGCNPPCDSTAGMVCVDNTCVAMTGTACTTDDDCATGETCADNQSGQDCQICLPPCSADDTTCPAGYECITAASMCYPTATFQGCPEVPLRNVECNANTAVADCPTDTICLTNSQIVDVYPWGWCAAECTGDTDCVQNSTFEEACVNIGINVCLAKCNTDADCPENIDCMDPFGFGFNVCSHQSVFFENGTLAAGETCGGDARCAFGNMCLGNPSMGYSCLATCDDHHDLFSCTDSQYCQHLGSETGSYSFGYCVDCGDQAPGAECTFGNMFEEAGECSCLNGIGSACLGIHPDNLEPAQREACTTADDCSAQFDPHPACVAATDGSGNFCGTSFCAPMCDEAGACDYLSSDDYDFQVLTLSGQCFCYPTPKGTQEAGQACTFGDINADAGNCVSGSACLGIDPARATTPDACETADDCDVDTYTTGIECIDVTTPAGKYCASSFCAPECNADNNCDDITDTNFNWSAANIAIDDQGNTKCYCIPQAIGTQTAGQTCSMGEFNGESGNCAAGLSCIGGVDSTATCTTAADCNMQGPNADCGNYTPDGGTAGLYCGYTWCSKSCTDASDCTDFGTDACCAAGADGNWCAPADYCAAE